MLVHIRRQPMHKNDKRLRRFNLRVREDAIHNVPVFGFQLHFTLKHDGTLAHDAKVWQMKMLSSSLSQEELLARF